MRYLIRALKYLIYFTVIFFLIVGIVYLFSAQKMAGISFIDLFKEGSLPKIALFFVAVAALYPLLGFQKKELRLDGGFTKCAETVDAVMESLDYTRENEGEGFVSYIKKGAYARLVRMWEDRITFETTEEGARVEGYRKDLLRIISLIKYKVQEENQ